jgi:sugar lactone lactonase YvrE
MMKTHTPTLLADGFVFLEGPRWHQNRLWISDMWGFKAYAISMDGTREALFELPERPSGMGFLPDGTPLVVSMANRKLMKLVGGQLVQHADLSAFATGDCNDMVVDAQGRAYVGNFGYDLFSGEPAKLADLVRVDADGSARVVAQGLNFPNGAVITDGGNTLVVAETFGNLLTAFDLAADGTLSNRRVWAAMGERTPDGICLDQAGGIWVASFMTSEFVRVIEGGTVTDLINVPGKAAVACQLGGPDGRTLFLSTYAGTIEDLHQQKVAGAIETVYVDSPAAGSP